MAFHHLGLPSIPSIFRTSAARRWAPLINLLESLDALLTCAPSQQIPSPHNTWRTGRTQARNQRGTPGGAKSFQRRAKIFWTMSNSFKRCPTHFSREGEKFSWVASLSCSPLVTDLGAQDREPRVHQAHKQGAVWLMEGPNAWGKQYLWPLRARGACCRPQAPKARKVSWSRIFLTGVYTPRRVGSQMLVLRFLHFLHASTQNSKDLERSTNSCDP